MYDLIRNAFRRRTPAEIPTDHPVMRDEQEASFLWLDRPDATRDIRRRRKAGEITRPEAKLLEQWARNGYVILERCVDPDLIDAALDDVDRAWAERSPFSIDVLTTGERTTIDAAGPEARAIPYKLNDLYLHSESVRRIFLDERIVRFGELVFGARVVGCNSLTFEYSTQQPAHVDHVYMTPAPARRLLAAWVACEDILEEAGPLEYWPGSHKLRPFDFGESAYHYTPEQDAVHAMYVAEQKDRFPKKRFLARKGDVLVWHSMLIHGGGAIERERLTRKSMAFHYFSDECMGGTGAPLAEHGRALYMTKGSQG